ncbi:MAG: hypothetical protein JO041_01840 [Acidobacteria bacterium]|nr:hypothetical protein [Acidobacteriota bacterium]
MKAWVELGVLLLLAGGAAAQAGTNAGATQEFAKPQTGNPGQVITSPDINAAVTGTMGSTSGQSGDVASGTVAVAGASSAAALTTGEVSTREQLEKQRLMQLVGKPGMQPEAAAPSPPFIMPSSQGKAQNGRNAAEASLHAGLLPGPSTDSGPPHAGGTPGQRPPR